MALEKQKLPLISGHECISDTQPTPQVCDAVTATTDRPSADSDVSSDDDDESNSHAHGNDTNIGFNTTSSDQDALRAEQQADSALK